MRMEPDPTPPGATVSAAQSCKHRDLLLHAYGVHDSGQGAMEETGSPQHKKQCKCGIGLDWVQNQIAAKKRPARHAQAPP